MLLFPSQRALPISHCVAFAMMRRASVETTEQSRLNDEWQQRVISSLSHPIRRLSRSVVLKQVPRCELVFLALACAFRFASCLYTSFFVFLPSAILWIFHRSFMIFLVERGEPRRTWCSQIHVILPPPPHSHQALQRSCSPERPLWKTRRNDE